MAPKGTDATECKLQQRQWAGKKKEPSLLITTLYTDAEQQEQMGRQTTAHKTNPNGRFFF